MPPAQRKIIGPEASTPWRLFLAGNKPETVASKLKETKKDIYIKVGVLTSVKGSAYLESGQTKIIAAVHPPRKITKQAKTTAMGCINCELKYDRCASVIANKAVIVKNEKYLSILLKKALEPAVCRQEFPNFQIDIVILVLQDSGCVLSSAINCCGAALVDGGVPMFDMVVSSTALVERGKIVLCPELPLDIPIAYQEGELAGQEEGGIVVMSQLATFMQISECFQKGYISKELLKEIYENLIAENENIAKIVRQVVVKKVKESIGSEKNTVI